MNDHDIAVLTRVQVVPGLLAGETGGEMSAEQHNNGTCFCYRDV